METKHYLRSLGAVALLLSIPLIAMQFTQQVQWTLSDFVIMGVMIFITGVLVQFAFLRAGSYRIIAVALILFGFVWLWAELAVGVFTNWGS